MWTPEEQTRWVRNMTAMVRSVAANDPEAFASLVELASWLQVEGLSHAYAGLVAQGYSAAEIARPLGVSRQAVHARYAKV